MRSKEEIVYEYWMAEYRENQRKRMERQIQTLEKKELAKPEYQVMLQNEDGVWEYHQAKPVSKEFRWKVELIWFILVFVLLFTYLEDRVYWKGSL